MAVNLIPLKEYLLDNVITSQDDIDENEPLFSTGLIDSFGILDLLFFINEEYNVSIEHFDLTDNEVDSLSDLGSLIEERK